MNHGVVVCRTVYSVDKPSFDRKVLFVWRVDCVSVGYRYHNSDFFEKNNCSDESGKFEIKE